MMSSMMEMNEAGYRKNLSAEARYHTCVMKPIVALPLIRPSSNRPTHPMLTT